MDSRQISQDAIPARYWWVNHKQTFHHEVDGGYLWSPKRNRNGAENRTYDNMTRVRPGEVVFSYASGAIRAIGYAASAARSAKQPAEFGRVGKSWSKHDGWKVPVRFTILAKPLKPALHMRELAPLLPPKYSPIRANGKGNQSVYLAQISQALATALQWLMRERPHTPANIGPARETQREREELATVDRIENDKRIDRTTKRYLIAARIGQGRFRKNVEAIEPACRITGITDPRFLRASHIRPWRQSNNRQRLDGNNGLLLAAHIDHLFDGGYISFTDEGDLIVSPLCPAEILCALGISMTLKVGPFRFGQQAYLDYHRQYVLVQGPGKRRRVRARHKRSRRVANALSPIT